MVRIVPVDPQTAQGKTKELLDGVKARLGVIPNMTRAMAVSPAVLEAYMGIFGALSQVALSLKVREQLALDVGQASECDYCVSAHSQMGMRLGLTEQAVLDSRQGHSADPKIDAHLRFARMFVETRGMVTDADVAAVGEAEIAQVVAHVGLNTFTNYFNHVANTTLDFPIAPTLPA
jgi:AhpD family alkylhydroperoxidase